MWFADRQPVEPGEGPGALGLGETQTALRFISKIAQANSLLNGRMERIDKAATSSRVIAPSPVQYARNKYDNHLVLTITSC